MQAKPRLVACPTCKKTIEYSTNNKFRPFCSERCHKIDLGDWASENYRIADNNPPKDFDEID
jgi:endogenous inhibitor of DNA gyrase (YacG/DUF329 family)